MKTLLRDIFNHDFSGAATARIFHRRFFGRKLTLASLKKLCDAVCAGSVEIGGETIPGAIRISSLPHRERVEVGASQGKRPLSSKNVPLPPSLKLRRTGPASPLRGEKLPFAILAQLHGNEPAGLAGIALAMALAEAGKLRRDVIGIVGNPLAAKQYFEAWEKAPAARQETRDAYRCGLAADGTLLPDMNRIPVDFLSREPFDHHTRRVQELYAIGRHVSGIIDIHSARGGLLCITDHKRDGDLKHSPIRNLLAGLAEAISANASATVTVQTFKTILSPLPNIQSQTGIEAGRHESPDAPHHAASFTLSLLHTLGLTDIAPLHAKEDGVFTRYHVRPRITWAELTHAGTLGPDDRVYMARACTDPESIPPHSDRVAVRKKDGGYGLQTILEYIVSPGGELAYALCQYDEMEAIEKGQAVAVAIPSGTVFTAPFAFCGIFVSKPAALYDKDPAVGPWPVDADKLGSVKFCYPCEVGEMKVNF